VEGLVEEALTKIQLREDQTNKLQQLGKEVHEHQAAVKDARNAFLHALGKGLAAGKIEPGALDHEIDNLADAIADAAPEMRIALEKLHDTLDAQQRTEFVNAFDEALRHRLRADRGTKWEDELGLSADQKARIKEILTEDAPRMDFLIGRLERVMAAFDSDKFNLDEIAPMKNTRERARRLAEGLVKVTGKIADVLTPEQRQKVADKLGKHDRGEEEAAPTEPAQAPYGQRQQSRDEATAETSQAIWAARRTVVGGGFGGAYGFSRRYVGGWGYMF
jgi:Spy/CpxP family protein refolding chaperone